MLGIQIRGIDDPSKNVLGYIVQGQNIRASSSCCIASKESCALCKESYQKSTPIKNIIFIFPSLLHYWYLECITSYWLIFSISKLMKFQLTAALFIQTSEILFQGSIFCHFLFWQPLCTCIDVLNRSCHVSFSDVWITNDIQLFHIFRTSTFILFIQICKYLAFYSPVIKMSNSNWVSL